MTQLKKVAIIIEVIIGILILGTAGVVFYLFQAESEESSQPQTAQNQEQGVADCGTTDILKRAAAEDIQKVDPEQEEALVCLGRHALTCTEARATVKDKESGPLQYAVTENENGNCDIRFELSSPEKIPNERFKAYAETYLACPLQGLQEAMLSQGEPKGGIESVPGAYGGNLVLVMSVLPFNTQQAKALGCSGTALEVEPPEDSAEE